MAYRVDPGSLEFKTLTAARSVAKDLSKVHNKGYARLSDLKSNRVIEMYKYGKIRHDDRTQVPLLDDDFRKLLKSETNPMINIHNVNFSQLSPSQQEAAYEVCEDFMQGMSFAEFQATANEWEWDAVTGEPVDAPADQLIENPSLQYRASELLKDVKHAFTKRKRSRQALARLQEAQAPALGVRPGKFELGKKNPPGPFPGRPEDGKVILKELKRAGIYKPALWREQYGFSVESYPIMARIKNFGSYWEGTFINVNDRTVEVKDEAGDPVSLLVRNFKRLQPAAYEATKRNPQSSAIRATDHPDTSPSYHARGTSTEVRSPTSTSTEVRSPTETSTSTSTDAYTAGNLTVTGGAGSGAYTNVRVYQHKMPESNRGSERAQRKPWDGVPQVHRTENPSNSNADEAYMQGRKWLRAKYRTSKSTFSVDGASTKFLKSMSLDGTLSLGYYSGITPRNAERLEEAKRLDEAFNQGVDDEWEAIKKAKRNPESSAADLYEDFHGRASRETVEIHTDVHEHESLTALGLLCSLRVKTPYGKRIINVAETKSPRDIPNPSVLPREEQILLCSNEDANSLYFIGGDQSVNLEALGFTNDALVKDLMVLGTLEQVTYLTQKQFDGFEDINYYHALGEETGEKPTLLYDPISCLLSVAGGAYRVTPAGLEN